jgi:hypothetical protein
LPHVILKKPKKIKITPKLPNTMMIKRFNVVATGQECYKEHEMEETFKQGQEKISAILTEVLLLLFPSGKYKVIPKFPMSNACFSGSTSFLYLMFKIIIFFICQI